MSDFKLLTKADAASIFGVCTKTIDNYIRDGLLPAPTPFGSREYWHPVIFRSFLDNVFGAATSVCSPVGTAGTPDSVVGSPNDTTTGEKSNARHRHKNGDAVSRQKHRQAAKLQALNSAA